MKKIKFLATAIAALTIVSCSKENVGDNEHPVVEGVETYATFNFKVEGSDAKSKAESETDAGKTDAETTVNDIRIIIFKSGTPSTLEVNTVTNPATVTTDPVKISSGSKRIFIFANTESNTYLEALKVGDNLNDCYASLMTPSPFSLTSFVDVTKGYFMSNARTQSSSKTLLPNISAEVSKTSGEANNHFTFNVQRAVAKVTAKITDNKILTLLDPVDKVTPIADLSDLKYTVRNINKSIRPVQLFAETNITDTDAELNTTLPLAPYFNSFDGKLDDFMKNIANFSDYDRSFDFDQTLTNAANDNAVFVTENSNARQVLGNTTYLAVKAKYAPKAVVGECLYDKVLNGGTFTPKAGTLGEDFFMVNLDGLNHTGQAGKGLKNNLFDTEEHAKDLLNAVLNANDIKPDANDPVKQKAYDDAIKLRFNKYTGGMTYYRLNIGVTEGGKTTFGIKRNSIYKVVISKINKLGVSSPEDLDKNPEIPVTSLETYVSATITIAEWVVMNQEGEL